MSVDVPDSIDEEVVTNPMFATVFVLILVIKFVIPVLFATSVLLFLL